MINIQLLKCRAECATDAVIAVECRGENAIVFQGHSLKKYLKLFASREDLYAQESLDFHQRRKSETDW